MKNRSIYAVVLILLTYLIEFSILTFTNLDRHLIVRLAQFGIPLVLLIWLLGNTKWQVTAALIFALLIGQLLVVHYTTKHLLQKSNLVIKAPVVKKYKGYRGRTFIDYEYNMNGEVFYEKQKINSNEVRLIKDSLVLKVSKSKPWIHEIISPIHRKN